MRIQNRLLSLLATCLAAILLVAVSMSLSNSEGQAEETEKNDQPHQSSGSGGGFGFGFGGGSGGGGGSAMLGDLAGNSPAIAVGGGYVFVVHEDTLYQFATDDLKMVKQVPLGTGDGL